ncbi:alpha-galactosidase [Natronosporangium hydrolyticum]|uniref:Alpha-galactosidase n=1 Tax=Natronosporangium hydrolyticum TaxID=2811111 RepID=A0A895Y914_9ACTN|nr:glycoside hydrolase family 36 protein [Natronosporangium hydrolyticum]QSB14227.1 alpha-galactosidase [Natronosporangium hydrolyticum]
MSTTSHRDHHLWWGHSALTVTIAVAPDAPPSMVDVTVVAGDPTDQDGQPIAGVIAAGHGRSWSGARSTGTAIGQRLRYQGHEESVEAGWQRLRVDAADPETGLRVEIWLRTRDGLAAFQTWTVVHNRGAGPISLRSVSSVTAGLPLPPGGIDDLHLHWAQSGWLAENRWRNDPVRELNLPDLDHPRHGYRSRGCIAVTSTGSWSTKQVLPTGVLEHRPTGRSWCWQVEHNGGWRWEVGEVRGGAYLTATGPNDPDHQWRQVLDPDHSFTTVPVAIAVSDAGWEGAVAAMTHYRRQIVRPHPQRETLPVVFNDYMNTLMGEPTSEALEPLIAAAGRAGAEYFCIDAGWFDDTRSAQWHEHMGDWQPSSSRFAEGLGAVIDRIRTAGMVPGLWLEPEVVGVQSQAARELPVDAFFQRDGERVVEDGRYHLDLRHPAAMAHLDQTVDRLVADFGVGYFKLDYNIDSGAGTDVAAASPGDGLLGHGRALLRWLEGVLDRHPQVVIESCASGAMRMDYGMLSRTQLQSTSDQQNPLRYPPIAVAAPMAVLPEQAANWAYPQPGMSLEEIAFCLVTGAAGRLYLSGHLDQMTAEQLRLVADGVAAYRDIRGELARAVPSWPLGLPGWRDPWVGLALRPPAGTAAPTYLALWRRPGASSKVTLRLPHLRGVDVQAAVRYPQDLPAWQTTWEAGPGLLTVASDGTTPAARLYRLAADVDQPRGGGS